MNLRHYPVTITLIVLLTLIASCRRSNRAEPELPSQEPTAVATTAVPTTAPEAATLPPSDDREQPSETDQAPLEITEGYPVPIRGVTAEPPSDALPTAYPPPEQAVPTYTPRVPVTPTPGADSQASGLSRPIPAVFLPLYAYLFPERPEGDPLLNGGFDSLQYWECLGGCRLEQQVDQGRSAVLVSQRSESYNHVSQDVTASIQTNGRYRSSVWLRSPDNQPLIAWILLEVETTASSEPLYLGGFETPILGGEWQQLVVDQITPAEGEITRATWRIETEPATANVLVDDASLTEVELLRPIAEIDEIRLFPDQPRQTIASATGGNFDHRSPNLSVPLDGIARFNIDNLGVSQARVIANLDQWQSGPGAPIQDSGKMRLTFEMMAQLQSENIEMVVSVYDVPDWLMVPPAAEQGAAGQSVAGQSVAGQSVAGRRVVDPNRYADLADMLVGWAAYGRDQYGVSFSHISFNEPNQEANTLWAPQGIADFISIAGPRFANASLDVTFMLGDCSTVRNCLPYSRAIWENLSARPYLGLVAVHSWDNPQPPDIVYEEFGAFAVETNLPLVITEVGWDAHMWQTGPPMESWEHALQTAIVYSKLLKLTGASQTHFWQMLGMDYPTNDGDSGYPVFHILQQLGEAIEPGAQIIGTTRNGGTLYSLAIVNNEKLAVQLINAGEAEQSVTLQGLFDGRYLHRRSSEGTPVADEGIVEVQDGEAVVRLRGSSVNWLMRE